MNGEYVLNRFIQLDDSATDSDAAFDSTPTRTGQVVSHVATFGVGVVLTIKRIALHNDTAANVTTSSTTLIAGASGQSLVKDATYSLTITMKITYADAS